MYMYSSTSVWSIYKYILGCALENFLLTKLCDQKIMETTGVVDLKIL